MKPVAEKLVYACGYCGQLYYDKTRAELCHSERTCSDCGKAIGKKDYYTSCKECRDKQEKEKMKSLIDKATKMSYDEYMDKYPNHPVVYGDRYFFDDYDYLLDIIEENEDETPVIWGAKQKIIELDSYQIIEMFEENVEVEDYYMDKVAQEELGEFCEEWNKKYAQDVYYEDYSVFIVLDKEE